MRVYRRWLIGNIAFILPVLLNCEPDDPESIQRMTTNYKKPVLALSGGAPSVRGFDIRFVSYSWR